jgi:hypothetical protein
MESRVYEFEQVYMVSGRSYDGELLKNPSEFKFVHCSLSESID